MAEKIATRAAYGNALVELAEKYPELVVFDADLAGATMTKGFMKAYPDRFFDMGIAEANMVGVAAGLSTCGKKPFVNTLSLIHICACATMIRRSCASTPKRRRTLSSCSPSAGGNCGAWPTGPITT